MTGPESSDQASPNTEYNEIAEGVTDSLIELDAEFRLLYLNAAAERFAGRTRSELSGKTPWEIFPQVLGSPVETGLRRCAAEAVGDSVEIWKEDTRRWYRVNITPRRAGGVIVWCRDVTDRQLAEERAAAKEATEERLRLSEERFRVALRDSGIFVWQQDSELRYTWYYNTAATVLDSDLIGRTDEALFPPDEAARLMELARHVIETGAGLKGYIQLTSRGQRRDFMYHLEPLRDASGRVVGLTGASVDVTEQKAFERGLLEAQKLDSIGLLAAGIAHDFNNLLVGIIGNASLAADMLPKDSPAAELLRSVLSSGERAAHLTRQILAYSGQGRFIIEKIDLSELVRDMSGLLQSSLREHTRLALDLPPDLGRIEADAPQMQQLVMNLVLNAAEAIGDGPGVVMVRTRAVTMTAAALRKSAGGADLPAGRYASLEIRDTGPGMDEQTKTRIFEPFFTTRSVGRGLGLPAALGIVRGHKGAIDVMSKPGKGTTVRVLLPLAGD